MEREELKNHLRNYNKTKCLIKNIELNLEEIALDQECTTESSLLKNKRRMEIEIEKIDNAINNLNKEQKEIIESIYFKRLKWVEVAANVCYSLPQAKRQRNKALDLMLEVINS